MLESSSVAAARLFLHENMGAAVTDNKQCFQTLVLPRVSVLQVMALTDDEVGHTGTTRTYILIRRLYYWRGLKANIQEAKYTQLHFNSPRLPLQLISNSLVHLTPLIMVTVML